MVKNTNLNMNMITGIKHLKMVVKQYGCAFVTKVVKCTKAICASPKIGFPHHVVSIHKECGATSIYICP